MRELAWSFARLSSVPEPVTCKQIPPVIHPRFGNTDGSPGFTCSEPASGGYLCPGQHQIQLFDEVNSACCGATFTSYWLPSYKMDSRVTDALVKLTSNCNCKGVVFIGFGIHYLVNDEHSYNEYLHNVSAPWSFPWGRRAGWQDALSSWGSKTDKLTIVIVGPPNLDKYVLMLDPPKPDWAVFKQFGWLQTWDHIDYATAKELGHKFVSYYEVTEKYSGLQCDGTHTGQSYDFQNWHCDGYGFLPDIVVQMSLNILCRDVPSRPAFDHDNRG